MAIELAKTAEEEIDAMWHALKQRAYAERVDFLTETTRYDTTELTCRVQMGKVHSKQVYVTSWLIDGRHYGYNAMRGELRRRGLL